MIKVLFIYLFCIYCLTTFSCWAGNPDKQVKISQPQASEILSRVKYAYPNKTLSFKGEIRPRRIGFKMIPLNVSFSSELIKFEFFKNNRSSDSIDETIKLSFHENKNNVQRIFNGKTITLKANQLADKIRGTDITYDDIAMRFLNWPNPILLSVDKAKGGKAWKIRCVNPSSEEAYSIVDVWVSQRSGALVKMNAFNKNRKIIKSFEVDSIQQIKGDWFVETMIVRTYPIDANSKPTSSFLKLESKN